MKICACIAYDKNIWNKIKYFRTIVGNYAYDFYRHKYMFIIDKYSLKAIS